MRNWILVAVALAFVSCSGRPSQDGGGKHDIPVRVMEIGEVANAGSRNYVGTASASRSAYVSCRYPGRLAGLHVAKGDYVNAGDVIAEVESQTVISSWEIAHSTLKQAEDGYERARKVHESGSMADVKMVEAETRLAQARASAAAADAALEDCKVKAPFSGVIGDVLVTEGEELDAVDRIALILDLSSVEIDFPVPEKELSEIDKGTAVSFSVPALGVDDAAAAVKVKGMTASPLSHTYMCTAVPVREVDGLMPGMVVKVRMDSGRGEGVVVPASVIRSDVSGRYVWTVSDDGTADKIYVVPGGFSGKGVIITEGLSVGDKVIVEGVQKVCTGLKVRIVE